MGPHHQVLAHPLFKPKTVPDKRRKAKDKLNRKEVIEWNS